MVEKAFITPNVLKWARESARISLESAAAHVNVKNDKLEEWESGISQPTIKQAEKLAHFYRRPFALFFLPEIPRDFMPLKDYRKPDSKPLSTASIFIIREIQQKQAWIRDVYEEIGNKKLPFVGRYSIDSDPAIVAEDILKTLHLSPLKYKTDTPIKEWIHQAEINGIFISRTSFIHSRLLLNSEEIQGFTIADEYAPFIFINSEDWNAPQLFTLVHELAHIWLAESGISNEIEPEIKSRKDYNPVELFCNEVAANALMPLSIINNFDTATFSTYEQIYKLSRSLGVSSFALLVRALKLQIISLPKYKKLKDEADNDFKSFLKKEEEKKNHQKKQKGGPNYYRLLVNKNSVLFTQVVLDAYNDGYIEASHASRLLNTKINNFHRLESFIKA